MNTKRVEISPDEIHWLPVFMREVEEAEPRRPPQPQGVLPEGHAWQWQFGAWRPVCVADLA